MQNKCLYPFFLNINMMILMRDQCLKCGKNIKDDPITSWKKRGTCKECYLKWRREYFHNNKDRIVANSKRSKRKHCLTLKDGTCLYGLNKRSYPDNDICEICEGSFPNSIHRRARLAYHHWDDKNPSNGIWVCLWCHRLVEAVDLENYEFKINKYIQLKKMIDNGYKHCEDDTTKP